jgi:hypothetical protein
MKISIRTGDELNGLLNALADEIVQAHIRRRLWCGLQAERPKHEREFLQSNHFWAVTLEALKDGVLTNLCRVYDQETSSLNLVNLLDTVKANLHLFSEAHFRERMAGNAFVDSLAKYERVPDGKDLDSDIKSVSCDNPLVKKLMIWRGNLVAHKGAKVALGKKKILTDNPLTHGEVDQLLEHALDTFNKYLGLYRASTWSVKAISEEDYKNLLQFLRLGLVKWDDDIEKQYERLGVRRKKILVAEEPSESN